MALSKNLAVTVVAVHLFSLGTLAQSQSDKIIYHNGPNLQLEDLESNCSARDGGSPCLANCDDPFYKYGYSFENARPLIGQPDCSGRSCPDATILGNASVLASASVANYRVDIIQQLQIANSCGRECCNAENSGTPSTISSFSVNVIDFRWTQNQLEVCPNSSTDLSNFLTYTSGTSLLGEGITGFIFNSTSLSPGFYTIVATNQFDNGNAEVNLTVEVIDITVNAGSDISVCSDDGPHDLSQHGFPAGGQWSGPGVTANIFEHAQLAPGDYQLTYTYTENNCTVHDQITATKIDPVLVDAGADQTTCIDNGLITLAGSPGGGVWSGPGVNGLNFDPVEAGLGVHQLTYTVTSGKCEGKDQRLITVLDNVVVDAGDDQTVCENDNPFVLSGAVPNGGNWSGPGVINNQFYPSITGPGSFFVTYAVIGSNNCDGEDGKFIIVNPSPTNIQPGPNQTLCLDGGLLDLTIGASPEGGIFQGPGVNGNDFDPKISGVGEHVITYTFQDNNGCSAIRQRTITVESGPVVEAGSDRILCLDQENIILSGTNPPTGGVWQGDGIFNGNTFSANLVGIGFHKLYYSFTGTNGCAGIDSILINVLPPLSAPNISTNNTSVCKGSKVTLVASLTDSSQPTDFNWYFKGESEPFETGSSIEITLQETTEILVEAVSDIGCTSDNLGPIALQAVSLDGDFSSSENSINSGDLVRFATDIEADTYDWDFGDNFGSSSEQNPAYYYYGAGIHTVTLTVGKAGLCERSIEKNNLITVRQKNIEVVTSIDEINKDQFKFYPVPFSDKLNFHFTLNQMQQIEISLLDLMGKKVMGDFLIFDPGEHIIEYPSMGDLKPGVFFLQINSNGISKSYRVIKD